MSDSFLCILDMGFELTLAILKPDVSANPLAVRAIRKAILADGFGVVRTKQVKMTRSKAENFYSEHEGKFFYGRLINFMSSGNLHVHVLARENAIRRWRELLGPTKVYKTRFERPDSIRGQFVFGGQGRTS